MQVKTITYTKILGVYAIGLKSMDKHMTEMMNEGWRVQSQTAQETKTLPLPGVRKREVMNVTYVKD